MASLELLDPRLRSPKATTFASSSSSEKHGNYEEEDDSEWEYEYSTTQTETFYVTLDLSKADFKAQDQVKNNPFPSRGSWQIQRASEMFLNRRKAAKNASHNSAASSAASSDAERDEEDQDGTLREDRGKQLSGSKGEENGEDSSNHERVQILELHSENPIISYKGRVFSGQWCENATTELIFTRHEANDSLPVLKSLEDGVDLLAASSSRINVTEQKFRPKVSERERQRASANLPQTVIPPVDPKATQERNDQRNFLADLIAIKRRKGETDDVTIIAHSMQGKRAKMKAKGIQTRGRGRWVSSSKSQAARGSDERPRRGGRRRGSGRARGRGKWAFLPLEEAPVRDSTSAASGTPPAEGESVSTPTPFRWDDLDEEQASSPARLEEVAEVDEQDEDEAESDDNNDYEEDEDDEMDEDDD